VSSSSASARSDSKLRILLVDDEPDILLTVNAILEGRGHYLKTFDNPAEALSHLTSSTSNNNGATPYYYDLVITDYRMPGSGMSGLRFSQASKEA
jgi:CheY-like chemotaxis protein